jgi:type I restriction enzyme S subunit
LGEIATIERDAIAPELIPTGTNYVGLENVTSEGEFVGVIQVNNGDLASTKFRFTKQHVLYGKLRPYLSKIARPDFSGVCSTDILPILPGGQVDRGYLYHFLRLPDMVELATSRSIGANLPRLSPSQLAAFEIPLPPLPEQKRIADILDKADGIRRKRQETISLTDRLIESAFFHLFGDVGTNQKRWVECDLDELRGQVVDCPHSTPEYATTPTGYHCVRSSDIQDGKIDLSSTREVSQETFEERISRHRPAAGEVVFTREGGRLGNAAQIPPGLAICLGQRMMLFSCKSSESTNEFIWALLNSPGVQRQIRLLTAGAAAPRINIADIRKFKVVSHRTSSRSSFPRS